MSDIPADLRYPAEQEWVLRTGADSVRVGIEAPAEVPIHRQEIYDEIQRTNLEALTKGRPQLPRLSKPSVPPTSAPGASA